MVSISFKPTRADPRDQSGRKNPRRDAEALIASPPVERVTIVGCGGSGKSYVARELGRLLDLPVIHMDAVYFDDHWNPLSMERFEAVQREFVAAPRWVIDGNYNSTVQVRLEAATRSSSWTCPPVSACGASCPGNCDTGGGRTIRTACTTESPGTSFATF